MEVPAPFDTVPLSGSSKLLGWRIIEMDPGSGGITIGFEGKREFANPVGFIQGGMLIAMMDDTIGPAVFAHTNGTKMTSSIDIHAHFLRPVAVGPVTVKARVVRLGKSVAFTEAELFDAAGRLSARATSSAHVVDYTPTQESRGHDA
ncbi:MAG: PaaI family thioesterase [Rhizobiaceae bacterium]|nr:PaaI family thioesterase [Rhizobiaceae bacterium]MCV0405854.1 PaaI family thioesterase [Rhizobiaceae bacterium]